MAAGCLAVLCSVRSWPSLPVRTISRRRFPRRERPRPSSRSATGRSSPPRAAPSPTAPCWCATARLPRSAPTCRFPPAPTSTTRTGKFVSPGIIDAHSHIANDAINEGSVSVSSMTGMEDVLDPSDINIYRDLAGGTTAANILHGSANAIGGKTVVIKLRYGKTRASDLDDSRRAARHQVRPRRERHAQARPGADQPAAVPEHAPGRRIRHPRRLHAGQGLPQGLAGLRGEEEGRPGRAGAAPRSAARRARRGARRQAPGARAQLPRRRDPDADPPRRRDGLQDHHLPARARGLQGGQGDRRAQRRRVHLLRLVGLQDGSGRRHSTQRLADDPQGRARLDQLGRRRAGCGG